MLLWNILRVHDLVPDQYLSHFAMKLSTLLRPIMCTVLEAATITALVTSCSDRTQTCSLSGNNRLHYQLCYRAKIISVFYLSLYHHICNVGELTRERNGLHKTLAYPQGFEP